MSRVLIDPMMRATTEATRPSVRTQTGLVLGAGFVAARRPDYACAMDGPYRRTPIWQRLWGAIKGGQP